MLLYESLSLTATTYPDRTAIHFRSNVITYLELHKSVNRCANAFREFGVNNDVTVAVLLGNCPQFTVTYYGITAIGGLCVPANPLLKPAELQYIWENCDAQYVVTMAALLPSVQATIQLIGRPIQIILIDEPPTEMPDIWRFDNVLASASDAAPDLHGIQDTDPAVCIYTSGTTGFPKGALLSHKNLTANCQQISRALKFSVDDNFLCVLPLFHSFAGTVCQNAPINMGASFTIVEQFHPARILETVVETGVTIFSGVPTMYGALLQFPVEGQELSSVRLCVSGGAPMPSAVLQAFEAKFNTIIIEGDGPTECGPATSVNPIDGVRKIGSVGLPIPGVEIKIFDDNNVEVATDELGEIVVRGENVMIGYLKLPQETEEAFAGGWYHTGDIGKIDSDGYVYILDRKKDMLLVGGFNVYPRELEELIYTHPSVLEATVIGMPDPLRGDEVTAVIVLKPGQTATELDIIHFCRKNLANFKVPRRVIFRASLPKGGTGKIVKRLLKKELEMEATSNL